MDENTISKLAELISDSWHKTATIKDITRRINGQLHRRKTSNVIKDYKEFVETIPKEKKKTIPIMTVILVLALFRRNLDEEEIIFKALKDNGLITALYGGLSILLNGSSTQISLNIKWKDAQFQNKYEFINRFQGEFLYWDYIEIFSAAVVIYEDNTMNFEKLLLKDKSRLLLLNISSGRLYNTTVSDDLILKLLNRQNELDRNIGFYLLTLKLNRNLNEIKQYYREKEMGFEVSEDKKRINDEQVMSELKRIENLLNHCSDSVKTSLILNYILAEDTLFPKTFSLWLLDPQLQNDLIKNIKHSNKINTLEKVYFLINVVSSTRRKVNSIEYPKIELYNSLADVIISFVNERKGIYQWTHKETEIMKGIVKLLPKKSKNKIFSYLKKEENNIMSLKFDKLVRFNIYLKDKSNQEVITGMISCFNNQ